jgi:hypothetical protein
VSTPIYANYVHEYRARHAATRQALLSARGYTVSDIENDQGQNVGWRVAW